MYVRMNASLYPECVQQHTCKTCMHRSWKRTNKIECHCNRHLRTFLLLSFSFSFSFLRRSQSPKITKMSILLQNIYMYRGYWIKPSFFLGKTVKSPVHDFQFYDDVWYQMLILLLSAFIIISQFFALRVSARNQVCFMLYEYFWILNST